MVKKLVYVIIFLVLLRSTGSSGSCTIFTASAGNAVLFGNNEDWDDKDTRAWVEPATETNHGAMYFGFSDLWAQGGMNDEGLCFDAASTPEVPMKPHPEKKRVLSFGKRVLQQCATVEEVIQFVEQHDLSEARSAQFLFADKMGGSVVVCPGKEGEIKVIRKEGVYQVITNFIVTSPQLGGYPCWRYSTCVRMLKEIENEDDLTVEYFTSILKAVSRRFTTYSTIYDLKNGVIYLYNQHNFDQVAVLNLEDELKKGRHTYYISSFFPKKLDESKKLEESKKANESLPEKSQKPETPPENSATPVPEPAPFNILHLLAVIVIIASAAAIVTVARSKGYKTMRKGTDE